MISSHLKHALFLALFSRSSGYLMIHILASSVAYIFKSSHAHHSNEQQGGERWKQSKDFYSAPMQSFGQGLHYVITMPPQSTLSEWIEWLKDWHVSQLWWIAQITSFIVCVAGRWLHGADHSHGNMFSSTQRAPLSRTGHREDNREW